MVQAFDSCTKFNCTYKKTPLYIKTVGFLGFSFTFILDLPSAVVVLDRKEVNRAEL